ncbi:uncharacterized protein LOC135495396 isoform X2 [Lineus longissimus]|uniref:uncharacterized protein LOC135495396 isoform X2 n=1 Tax=Lineus longissimus TaxID=88925 RepID=UPI00315DD486
MHHDNIGPFHLIHTLYSLMLKEKSCCRPCWQEDELNGAGHCEERMGYASTGVPSQIAIQPGPVEVKQGHNVSLWCRLKNDTNKDIPVNWHSPPNFRTITTNCESYAKDKHKMSCSDTEDSLRFYNLSIMDAQWTDKGEYRCLRANVMAIVDLHVLVPVTEVRLKKIVERTVDARQHLQKNLTCTTNCAYPAPIISWFVNDEPFNGNATVTEMGCEGAKEGQYRTESTVTDMEEDGKEYDISCTAENVVGEPNVSKTMPVNCPQCFNYVTPSPHQSLITHTAVIGMIVAICALFVIALTIGIVFIRKKYQDRCLAQAECEPRFVCFLSRCADYYDYSDYSDYSKFTRQRNRSQ